MTLPRIKTFEQARLRIERVQHLKATATEPEIYLFEDVVELQRELGFSGTHGAFDPAHKIIYATPQSLAHELAHYKDHLSGGYRSPHLLSQSDAKDRARLRNEIVAVLFSWQKMASPEFLLAHEKEFLTWFHFQLDKNKLSPPKDFKEWKFKEIQNSAEDLTAENSEHWNKLKVIFAHYLNDPLELPRSKTQWIL
jgi:hypothetical protein